MSPCTSIKTNQKPEPTALQTVFGSHYGLHNYALLLCLKQEMDFSLDFRKEFIECDKLEHTVPSTQTRSHSAISPSRSQTESGPHRGPSRTRYAVHTQLLINMPLCAARLRSFNKPDCWEQERRDAFSISRFLIQRSHHVALICSEHWIQNNSNK